MCAKKAARYELRYSPGAARDIKKLKSNRSVLIKILATIEGLRENPRPHGVKHLTGEDAYRVRNGDFRVIYEIDDARRVIFVSRVSDRKDAY